MDQETLRNFWRSAPDGRLSPWEQAKALGLREASKVVHKGKANIPWIAFRRHEHLAILLDEVQDPSFIVQNKNLLQAHVDGAILGQSATQMFTYEVFL